MRQFQLEIHYLIITGIKITDRPFTTHHGDERIKIFRRKILKPRQERLFSFAEMKNLPHAF